MHVNVPTVKLILASYAHFGSSLCPYEKNLDRRTPFAPQGLVSTLHLDHRRRVNVGSSLTRKRLLLGPYRGTSLIRKPPPGTTTGSWAWGYCRVLRGGVLLSARHPCVLKTCLGPCGGLMGRDAVLRVENPSRESRLLCPRMAILGSVRGRGARDRDASASKASQAEGSRVNLGCGEPQN